MPRALRIDDRPDETAVLWLEVVDHRSEPWNRETYVEAAGLLGRLSGSARVAELADIDPLPWHIQYFVQGRIAHTVLPGLFDDATWRHELVAPHFGGMRAELTAVANHLDPLAEEFAALPHRASHGDACPNNLLRHPSGAGFTLIDYGFWRPQPVGLRPLPAPGRRHPDRPPRRRRPARARRGLPDGVRRRAGGRGPRRAGRGAEAWRTP